MKNIQNLLFLSIGLFVLSSCEALFLEEDTADDPQAIFDQVWRTVDEKYVYFDYKGIDWVAVRNKYQPRIKAGMSDDSLYNVLADMLFELKDGHVNLSTPNNRSRNWKWFTGFPSNYNREFVGRQYLNLDQMEITGGIPHNWIGNVGYLSYASFSEPIGSDAIDYIMTRYQSGKGLIIDIRNNGGGDINNAVTLLSRLIDKRTLVGKSYQKAGKAHNDFTEPHDWYIDPKGVRYTKPVIILTNRACYSAATFFPALASQLPNVRLVGDRTGGGGGAPTNDNLPNGWSYRFTTNFTVLVDGFNFEYGIDPDVKVSTGPADELLKKDQIIEKAIQLLQ